MRERFSRPGVASRYTAGSAWHAGRAPLAEVVAFCEPRDGDRVLDVATGAGNTALALAPRVRFAIGLDLTPAMLGEARRQAAGQAARNVAWVLGEAAQLPFPDRAFDLYTVRAAPHHFADLGVAAGEALRVLVPGGRGVFIDCSPPQPARDLLHDVEAGRDPSHVLSHTLDDWTATLVGAGFRVEAADRREREWDFEDWMDRQGVPSARRRALAVVIETSTGAARDQLRPRRTDGRLKFQYWHAFIRAVRP